MVVYMDFESWVAYVVSILFAMFVGGVIVAINFWAKIPDKKVEIVECIKEE